MNIYPQAHSKKGFSLVEVTLAIGIVGMAILSLVGILGSTFQQVDDIMLTNRAVAGVTRLVGALDNPKSILWLNSSGTNLDYLTNIQKDALGSPAAGSSSNFDLTYRIINSSGWKGQGNTANSTSNGVWLFVYERKMVGVDKEVTGSIYNISSNPSVMEVAACDKDDLKVEMARDRNIVGVPMRVRISISKLLVGQPFAINETTLEPDTTNKWPESGGKLNKDPNLYPLAYLPLVVEFFPHDYVPPTGPTGFKNIEQVPILVQNIVISR
jgi:type II secretory pathway pseudopilin PulG